MDSLQRGKHGAGITADDFDGSCIRQKSADGNAAIHLMRAEHGKRIAVARANHGVDRCRRRPGVSHAPRPAGDR
jgi:hypothetical protein